MLNTTAGTLEKRGDEQKTPRASPYINRQSPRTSPQALTAPFWAVVKSPTSAFPSWESLWCLMYEGWTPPPPRPTHEGPTQAPPPRQRSSTSCRVSSFPPTFPFTQPCVRVGDLACSKILFSFPTATVAVASNPKAVSKLTVSQGRIPIIALCDTQVISWLLCVYENCFYHAYFGHDSFYSFDVILFLDSLVFGSTNKERVTKG